MLVLMCQAGNQRFAIAPHDVAEVTPRVQLRLLAGSPDWVAGVCVYRGQVTPIVDLSSLITGSRCPLRWSNRILLVPVAAGETTRLCGLLVESVTTAQLPNVAVPGEGRTSPWISPWGPVLLDEQGLFELLEVPRLLPPERCARLFLPTAEQA